MTSLFRAGLLIWAVALFPEMSAAGRLSMVEVLDGLDSPVSITHCGDGRLFVAEQGGRIRVWDGTTLRIFMDLRKKVSCCGERGLLGVAFHPDYAVNGRFFASYTDKSGNVVLAECREPASVTVLLKIPHSSQANHNGGQIAFGPDRYLYAGIGDGGGAGDPGNNAQSLTTLLGKILRIDVNGTKPYAIPPTNPFAGGDPRDDAIWARGLRNPWRFSFDRKTADLFVADVGQDCWEEVNWQRAGSGGGENYGWHVMEANKCYDSGGLTCSPPPICDRSGFRAPIITYGHSGTCTAIVGGYRYRGRQVPGLRGTYLYADYCSGTIWGASKSPGGWTSREIAATDFFISTFGEDSSGEIYVADAASGRVFRINGYDQKE
ncbi:MAG: PQQ-dependent sugar dehydrogenase [Acidobacteria bacterium]|nr:PQQ-dependent sugar dehydrogenase [Acidobacteriota bacterium]